MPQRTIDTQALDELVGRVVGDFGATLSAALVNVGDRLGLYRAIADAGSVSSPELAAATGTVERNVREWLAAQAAAGYVTYDGDGRYSLTPGAGGGVHQRGQPGVRVRRLPARHGGGQVRREGHRGVPHRCRAGLARAPPRPVRRHRALLPAGLRRLPRDRVAAGARRRRRQAAKRGARRRRRLRPRRIDHAHGPGTSRRRRSAGSTTTPSRSTPPGEPPRRPEWPPTRLPGGRRRRLPGRGIRPRVLLRLPARHGRSRGGARPCPGVARRRRHGAARRAGGRRRGGGQPQPGRPGLLLGLDADVHAELAVAGRSASPSAPRPAWPASPTWPRQAGFTSVREATRTPFNIVLELKP